MSHSLLLLEGDPMIQKTVVRSIAKLPIEIVIVSTLAEARAALEARTFDIVCWPSSLPGSGFIEIIEELKKSLGRATWHVAYTTMPFFADALIEAGCTPKLRLSLKSYLPSELLNLLAPDAGRITKDDKP